MKELKSVLIILIGNELLNGSIQDKNAKFLLEKLALTKSLELEVIILPDNRDKIISKLQNSIGAFDLIVTSGGLGPTTDDLTIEAVSTALELELVQNESSLNRLKEKYKKRDRPLTENSIKQTFFPKGSLVFDNDVGTADACVVKSAKGSYVACFPGVPLEFNFFINNKFWPWLENTFNVNSELAINHFRVFGVSEAYIGSVIEGLNLDPKITVAYRPQFPEVLISLKSNSLSQLELNTIQANIINNLGTEFAITHTENKILPVQVLDLLQSKQLTLATAESCTGGRMSAEITKIPGCSNVYLGSIICYSNQIKRELLNISEDILEKHGAVSNEVALLLAKNVQIKMKTNLAISITGIAGPDGGTSDKPVGLVYIGLATPFGVQAFKYQMPWDRVRNQIYSTWLALDLVRRSILEINLTWDMK